MEAERKGQAYVLKTELAYLVAGRGGQKDGEVLRGWVLVPGELGNSLQDQ